jgi:hypothetical protein
MAGGPHGIAQNRVDHFTPHFTVGVFRRADRTPVFYQYRDVTYAMPHVFHLLRLQREALTGEHGLIL